VGAVILDRFEQENVPGYQLQHRPARTSILNLLIEKRRKISPLD
jgi:hypothetical protein